MNNPEVEPQRGTVRTGLRELEAFMRWVVVLLRQHARDNSFISCEGRTDSAHDGGLAGQTRALPQPVNRFYASAMRAQKVGDFELLELVSSPVQLFVAR